MPKKELKKYNKKIIDIVLAEIDDGRKRYLKTLETIVRKKLRRIGTPYESSIFNNIVWYNSSKGKIIAMKPVIRDEMIDDDGEYRYDVADFLVFLHDNK